MNAEQTPRVFIIHEQARWVGNKRMALDFSSADIYGRRVVVFPDIDRSPPVEEAMPAVRQAMADFQPDDYLVIAGDMDLLIWAAAIALNNTGGRVNLLKWNNRSKAYDVCPAPKLN